MYFCLPHFFLSSLFFGKYSAQVKAEGLCYVAAGGTGIDPLTGKPYTTAHSTTCATGYVCSISNSSSVNLGECVKAPTTITTATPYSSPKATPINKCASECIRDDAPPGCAAGSTAATDCGSCGLDQFGAAKICCKPNSCTTTTATKPPTTVVNGKCITGYKVVCGTGSSCQATSCNFPNQWKDQVNECGHLSNGAPMYSCLQCSCQKIATATPSASPLPVTGSCSSTKIYTTGWTEITPAAFQGLTSGIQVYFCANGVASSGSIFNKARFTINGVLRPETTIVNPQTKGFCDLYTIPANTYSFKVQGEIHHATLGWL